MASFHNKLKNVFPSLGSNPHIAVGLTPKTAIWKKNKATLWYYQAPVKKFDTPLFLVYSLINQAFVLDLGLGASTVEGFLEQGYDVYLLDFGIPGYEDKHIQLADYIIDYISTAVRRAINHSGAKELTMIGYCLGGTLAVIYAAVANEPIRNLVLFAAPIDFTEIPYMDRWHEALKNGDLTMDELIDEYGIVPAKAMEVIFRLITAPINLSPSLALLSRWKDKKYIERWQRFDKWAKGHVPFAGAALKDLLNDLVIENKLINNKLELREQRVKLNKIKANLLVVSTEGDQLIPKEMIQPMMAKVGSKDKTFLSVRGGHVTLAIKGGIPDFLAEWLEPRS